MSTTFWLGTDSKTGDACFVPTDPIPAGTIVWFAGDPTAIPDGYLACDGRLLSTTSYPALFSSIGRRYSTDTDSVGVFRVPDARKRIIESYGSTSKLVAIIKY